MISSEDLQNALMRLVDGTATSADQESIQQALQARQIVFTAGDRAVTLGGNATGSVIITGDNNVVVSLTGADAIVRAIQQMFPEAPPAEEVNRAFAEQSRLTQADLEAPYITYLRQQYQDISLGGIAPRVQDRMIRLPLEELFVPPQAEENAPLQTQFVMRDIRGYQAVRIGSVHLLGLRDIAAAPRAVILGEPGAGKSTLLRWMVDEALKIYEQNLSNEAVNHQKALPIFIRLAQFAAVLETQPELGLDQYLQHHYLLHYRLLFAQLLVSGRMWLLLDGLDEVADAKLRRRVRDALEIFNVQYSHIERIVATSRIVGYRTAPLSDRIQHFTLQPFAPTEISQFIHNWYRAVCRRTEVVPDYSAAERRATRLIDGLLDKPRVLQLASNPLFLAVIALMSWKGKEIPQRRVELYEVAIKTLLEDWPTEQGRQIENTLALDEMMNVLSRLSYEMFQAGYSIAIRRDHLEQHLVAMIKEVRGCSQSEAQDLSRRWLPILSEQSGLLLDAGVDEFYRPVYTFLHLSFVEYFSARALAEQWRTSHIDLATLVNDPRWREVLLLLVGYLGMDYGIAETTQLVREIHALKPPHHDVLHQSLVLAAACLADDGPVAAGPRDEILDETIALWQSNAQGRLRSKLFRILAAMHGTDYAQMVVKRILPLLQSDRGQLRSNIVELLSNLISPSDVSQRTQVLNAFDDPEVEVQRAVVRAIDVLGLADDAEGQRILQRALQHVDSGVRIRAVLALRVALEADQALRQTILHLLMQDPDNEVRRMAARVLGAIKHPDNVTLNGIITAIYDAKTATRKEAAAGFKDWDTHTYAQFVTALHQSLLADTIEQRRKAVEVLADIGMILGQQAVDLLLNAAQATSEEDEATLIQIAQALSSTATTDHRVIHLLGEVLASKNIKMRIHAAAALQRLGVRDAEVSQRLVQGLKHPSTGLRRSVAQALGTCGMLAQQTIQALEEAFKDVDELVRIYAAQSIVALGAKSAKVQDMLLALLGSKNSEVRRLAVHELRGMIHHLAPGDVESLVKLAAQDKDRLVREAAVMALAEQGHKADAVVITACRMALHDSYHEVQEQAAEALARFGKADEAIIDELLAALDDIADRVRLAASNALITLGEGREREVISSRVRKLLDQRPQSESAINTLWGLVIGE